MNPKPQTPHLETLRPKSRPPRQPGPPGVTEDESPGDMSDDEIPELEDIPHWPNVEAIGTEGHDLPQPLLPQHWVLTVECSAFTGKCCRRHPTLYPYLTPCF